MIKFIIIVIALFTCVSAYSQVTNDTLFFNNGSVVIGKLKSAKLGVVTFDPSDANDITVQLRKLHTIAGGNRIFRLERVDHHVYFGRILTHAVNNTISIVNRFSIHWP